MTELCNCPFCGAAPRVYQTEYRIMCSDQHCSVRPSVFSNDLDVATTRWNQRHSANQITETVLGMSPLELEQFLADNDYSKDGIIKMIEKQYDEMVQKLVDKFGEVVSDVD